jgi:DNA-binding Lrp family transcriptional regulator
MALTPTLDKFDLALLNALQQDNTTPLRELADLVHLSTASVQRRVQRMLSDGIIKANVAVVDAAKAGKGLTLVVEVHTLCVQTKEVEALKRQFSGPAIQQCYYVTGEVDFVLVITVADMEEFQLLANGMLHDNPQVKWFRTMVVMDSVKSTLQVPLEKLA